MSGMKLFGVIVAFGLSVSALGQSVVMLPQGAEGVFLVDPNAFGGATNIAAAASDGYNPVTRTLTWNTNAAGAGAFADWLSSDFTNAVQDEVGSISITGAVDTINGLQGTVIIAGGTNVTITTNGNTLGFNVGAEYAVPYSFVNTNVSGTWTIDFDAGPVQEYIQTGAITTMVASTTFTDRLVAVRVVLTTTTSTFFNRWPTNVFVWSGGSAPVTVNNKRNIFFFERAKTGRVNASYIGTED